MKKRLNTEGITNELAGASLFFSGQKRAAERPATDTPLPEEPVVQGAQDKAEKPADRQTDKSINALQPKQGKFDKYSTYLRPGYKKEMKSIALERDCKDYEVLDEALTLFFDTRKK
jgi:hypothetical protein